MTNITDINTKTTKDHTGGSSNSSIRLHIFYLDNTAESYLCDYFGQSVESPDFMIIGYSSDEMPIAMIRLDVIKKVIPKGVK